MMGSFRRLLAGLVLASLIPASISAQQAPGPSDQVAFDIELYELNLSAARELDAGFDFAPILNSAGQDAIVKSQEGEQMLVVTAVAPGPLREFLKSLNERSLLTTISESRLETVYGRPAGLRSGGEFPLRTANDDGTTAIDFQRYGTQIDVFPTALETDRLHADLRISVTEINDSTTLKLGKVTVPGLRVQEFEAAFDQRFDAPLVVINTVQDRIVVTKNRLGLKKEVPAKFQLIAVATPRRRLDIDVPAADPRNPPLSNEARSSLVFKLQVFEVNLTQLDLLGLKPRSPLDVFVPQETESSLGKVLAAPVLVTQDGQPATVNVGGEIPVPGLRATNEGSGQSMSYGTRVDVSPRSLDAHRVRTDLRVRVSELDSNHALDTGDVTVPGLRVRELAGTFDLEFDRPRVVRHPAQRRVEASRRIGRTNYRNHDIQCMVIVTMTREADIANRAGAKRLR